MLTRRDFARGSVAGLAACGAPAVIRTDIVAKAWAQPARNVRILVGFPPGGGTDVLARILAERLKDTYAATAIVENKPGAAARLAVEAVKAAEPDGNTMLFTPDFPITVYPSSFKSLSYDPVKDLTPVAPAAKSALAFSVGPAVPGDVKTMLHFVEWCRAHPAQATYATTAAGGTPHFTGLMLSQEAKLAMTPVHYKGGAPALQDLLGGHVASSINPVGEALPFNKAGSVRVLAVTSARRSAFLPEVPTMREAGYNVTIDSWLGVLVPAKTPDDTVQRLNLAIRDAFTSLDVTQKLASIGNEPDYQTPADFAARVRADIARWQPIVKASGFVAD